MAGSSSESARRIAAEVLRQFEPRRAQAGPILNRLLSRTDEKQRTTDLVFGVIRNLQAIDKVIATFSGRPIERINKTLLAVIRVGVYELVYRPDSPSYSIVNEAVNTAKHIGGKKQTGFVNAVLRQVVRHIAERQKALPAANPKRTLIQTAQAGCEFDTDLLPDPEASPATYLSTCFSLPQWLVEDWLSEFGPEQTRQVCFGSNRRPSVYARVNPLRTTGSGLLEQLAIADIRAETVAWKRDDARSPCEMIKITGPHAVPQLPGFSEGLFTVQDIAASHAVRMLDPQPDWTILDLCAAPGTKTMQLAEVTRDSAQIIATDIDAKRLTKINENLTRFALKSVSLLPYAQLLQQDEGSFDAILLDVPCSNTGVLAKRIEVRFRVTRNSLKELARTQRSLLDKAARLVKPGGRICYSTCSIQSSENSDPVRAFLQANGQFELTGEELILPSAEGFDHDGAYAAVLTRRA
jgi:16S rRNA (cytosine967-C5)-methyltransferase